MMNYVDFYFLFVFVFIPNRYVPTLWGYSGHLQTVFQSIVGRVKCPWPCGERIYMTLNDNSTLTYDLYPPLNEPNGRLLNTSYSLFSQLFLEWFTYCVEFDNICTTSFNILNQSILTWNETHKSKTSEQWPSFFAYFSSFVFLCTKILTYLFSFSFSFSFSLL